MHREGWHRALDVQLDQHKWITGNQGYQYTSGVLESIFGVPQVIDEDDPMMVEDYAERFTDLLKETLWRGDTVFLTSDMLHIAMQAAEDLPKDFRYDPHTCMSRQGFILLEESVVGQDRNLKNMVINALAWVTEPIWVRGTAAPTMTTCIYIFTDVHDPRDEFDKGLRDKLRDSGVYIPPVSLCHFYPLLDQDNVPFEVSREGQQMIADAVKLFCAIQILSRQSIGTVTLKQPNRAQRKRYERDYNVASDRMITLITLRRKSMPSGKEPKDIPWTRRWVVRGHWRNQYYSKTKTHAWKYIYEYVKGPEDKPLITGRRVFNFRR